MSLRLIVAGLVGLAAVGLAVALVEEKTSEATYLAAAVERGDLSTTLTATGSLKALVTVQVGSQLSGQIADLLVDFNDEVNEGEPSRGSIRAPSSPRCARPRRPSRWPEPRS